MAFARFMSQAVVRTILMILGMTLIVLGFFVIGGAVGIIVGMTGFVPLVAEVVDVCLIGPSSVATQIGARTCRTRPSETAEERPSLDRKE